ncbi:helix-turn-helix domain-containing protein [Escherichia coli]|uniref:MarR family transcriptional regulator n=2 Tax=Escherichia coli TaxID=562 RepID=UPI000929926E|nr:helix-turn-helix domain-containing protein [Escherichia coli]EKU6317652.1 MarR family transcriptional regulator [Escherichia coli]EKX1540172.1 MarR family transcriptional regulator [Escherichia coli]MBL7372051.1 MarR family transcriptional regulator [Escherichia coli]MBL7386531.1 MarR family transcriptional regulator [Escherichia coli]MBL7415073.1 MarR family transcriptional regulator [Escherichia coli]
MSAELIKQVIISNAATIRNRETFFNALEEFYENDKALMRLQPAFFKHILNESRFNIILMTCCFIFSNSIKSIKDIKNYCKINSISSQNSIIAVIALLKASGRIDTERASDDRRNVKLVITQKGLKDLKNYIYTVIAPLKTLYPEYNFNMEAIASKSFLQDFFHGVSVPLLKGVTYKQINTKINCYIEKDGGRSLLLYLYMKSAINNMQINSTINQLAFEISVSRTQVMRLVNSLEKDGYICSISKKNIIVNQNLIELVEDYISIYFSYIEYYLLSSADLKSILIEKKMNPVRNCELNNLYKLRKA